MIGNKNKRSASKGDRNNEGAVELAKPTPIHQKILKREHAPHELFEFSSFPFDEIIPNWKGEAFDAHFMNAATGRTFKNRHHVKGEGTKKRSDFERFEFAFCLEWIDRIVDGVTLRDRCYNQFTVKSNGCIDHPRTEYKDGPNRVYYKLIRGEACNWGMLSDPQTPAADESRKFWGYQDYLEKAEALALEEHGLAIEECREDQDTIVATRMAEFGAWWRQEEKTDKQHGGAKATAARGYSMVGQRTLPPPFMSCRFGERIKEGDHDPLPDISRMTLIDRAALASRPIANNRQRFGKSTTDGRPDLDAKRMMSHQAKGKKSLVIKDVSSVKAGK